jgi:hypothetical protein
MPAGPASIPPNPNGDLPPRLGEPARLAAEPPKGEHWLPQGLEPCR